MRKIEITDILFLIGLALQGVGFFLFLGLGISLSVTGTELLLLAAFGRK